MQRYCFFVKCVPKWRALLMYLVFLYFAVYKKLLCRVRIKRTYSRISGTQLTLIIKHHDKNAA